MNRQSSMSKYLANARMRAGSSARPLQSGQNSYFAGVDGQPAVSTPPAAAAVQPALPYIITVSNASGNTITNFDVLGAFEYINNSGFANGSLTISGVTISSGLGNVTYRDLLYQSMNLPFEVGQTYINVQTGSNAQLLQTLNINSKDATGRQSIYPITPVISPNQYQSSNIIVPTPFQIGGFTKITIASILPSVVFTMQFYAGANVSLERGLTQGVVGKQYNQPTLNNGGVVTILNK